MLLYVITYNIIIHNHEKRTLKTLETDILLAVLISHTCFSNCH